jgi:hypothetical protein
MAWQLMRVVRSMVRSCMVRSTLARHGNSGAPWQGTATLHIEFKIIIFIAIYAVALVTFLPGLESRLDCRDLEL